MMLDAAQDAGVLFEAIREQLQLPSELIPLADKAIAQVKAVHLGRKPPAVTKKERRLIGKYTCCSATWNIRIRSWFMG